MKEQTKEVNDPSLHSNGGVLACVAVSLASAGYWLWTRLLGFSNRHPWLAVFILIMMVAALAILLFAYFWNRAADRAKDAFVTSKDVTSVDLGKDPEGKPVHLKQRYRTTHMEVIGTTSAGKTESIILPSAITDIETGAGLLIIDGKSDVSFLEKFYAYAVKNNRKKDFRLFSLAMVEQSATFNPLVGGSSLEVAERVFSSFKIENEYYKNVQFKLFHAILELITETKEVPTFNLVQHLLTNRQDLETWVDRCSDPETVADLRRFLAQPEKERLEAISGLDSYLTLFSRGPTSVLFNTVEPMIILDEVLRENLICYFQIPSMYFPQLAPTMGKLILQGLQSAVARRHLGLAGKPGFFACYLDDFQDYIYEGFGALLNKSRSANVGVVFSHQAIGDLKKVSDAFTNVVLTNTNIKVIMRCNDPDTCDYFARSLGTESTEKVTERQTRSIIGATRTGEGSVREVEQFRVHPNEIRGLGTGQGFVTIPHFDGVKTVRVRFTKRPDIDPVPLPTILKAKRESLPMMVPLETSEINLVRPRLNLESKTTSREVKNEK